MNRKQFVILLVVGLVVGLAGWKYSSQRSASYSGGGSAVGQKLLDDFDVNAVAQISIKDGAAELTLVKKDDLWRVSQRNNYPAVFTASYGASISGILLKLKDLKVVQAEAIGASQLPRLHLGSTGSNAATVVKFSDASGKEIRSLLLGKKHVRKEAGAPAEGEDSGFPDGRFVMVGGSADKVVLVSDALADLEAKPENWLNKDFFKIEKPRSIAVTFANATNSWKLERDKEGGDLKLVDAKPGENLDSAKASGAGTPFSSASFVDVVIDPKPETTGLDKATVVKVDTFEGYDYTIRVGSKTNDNYYVTLAVAGTFPKERIAPKDEKPEDKARLDKEFAENLKKSEEKLAREKAYEGWTYRVSGWPVDSILKERAQLMVEKKDEKKDGDKKDDAVPVPITPDSGK